MELEIKKFQDLCTILGGKQEFYEFPNEKNDAELTEAEAEGLKIKGDQAFYGIDNEGFEDNENNEKNPNYTKAMQFYYDAAQCGSSKAWACLGKMYEHGLGCEKNIELSSEFYQKGAEASDAQCLFVLGKYYEKGIINYIKQDNKKIELLTPEQHLREAVKCYEKSARKQNSDAITKLGYLHEKGIFYPVDKNKAISLYELASEKGNSLAINYLGAYYFGLREYEKAVDYFCKSANLNCARAANNLGICYENGYGVVKNETEALFWYEKAAEQGFSESHLNAGFIYLKLSKIQKSQKYAELATKYLLLAYENNQENPELLYVLGMIFEKGISTQKDLQNAMKFYKKAEDKGFLLACRGYADTLVEIYKKNTEKSELLIISEKIREIYEKGYRMGNDLICGYKLAVGYLSGNWIKKNEEEGLKIMHELEEKKFNDAVKFLKVYNEKIS